MIAVLLASSAPGWDAHIYHTVNPLQPYADSGTIFSGGYQYPPPFAWLAASLQALPFVAFYALILLASLLALGWLVGPWLALLLIPLPPIWTELTFGNINLIVAALVVIGMRTAVAFTPLVLVKATPGIGLLWHLFRGHWRGVGMALAFTLPFLLLPGWGAWIRLTVNNVGADGEWAGVPFALRALMAAGTVAYAGRTNRAWLVPVAVAILAHNQGLGWLVLLAVPRLVTLARAS